MKTVQQQAQQLADELKRMNLSSGSVEEHFDLPDIWLISNNKDLQISYCNDGSGEWGPIGYAVADANGVTIYTGISMKEAVRKINEYVAEE